MLENAKKALKRVSEKDIDQTEQALAKDVETPFLHFFK
jgi:hypothetical protein